MNKLLEILRSTEDDWLFTLLLDAMALAGVCVLVYIALTAPYVTGFEELNYYHQYGGENQ